MIKEEIRDALGDKITAWEEKSALRVYFSVNKEDVLEATKLLFKEFGLRFSTASGIDMPGGFEILYHYSFDKSGEIFSMRVFIEDKKNPEIDAITPVFPGAEWIEREMWEMLGINFKGHPNLKRLLLAEDWPEGKYPLRHEG